MRLSSKGWRIARILAVSLCLPASAALCRAETPEVAGEYVCLEAHVAGKTVPCKAAPLSLKSDGRFELQGREGDYLVKGHWVELHGTVLNSRAKIEAGHKIVFRFYNRKGLCEMIYERRTVNLGKTKLG